MQLVDRLSEKPKLTVAQLGARHHYAIPQILNKEEMLAHFYTDICAVKGWSKLLRLIPPKLQNKSIASLVSRLPHNFSPSLITDFSKFGLEYVLRLRQARSDSERTKICLWAGKTFGKLILKQGIKGTGVYTFNTAGLELLSSAKKQGLLTVMEQTIAPSQIEYNLLQEEQKLYPNWEESLAKNIYRQEYIEREFQEWEQADIIICGSQFVKDGIQQCGGPVERCVVVPYGVDTRFRVTPQKHADRLLRVLTIGAVGLRKGSPYVLEAAKKLQGKALFRMVGATKTSKIAQSSLQQNLELIGRVPRSRIREHYAWADVFLLPSICEGSATVTYEALTAGLPVIATPNTGSIIEDKIDGFIVPIRNSDAIVEKLELLISQPELLAKMKQKALKKSNFANTIHHQQRLIEVFQ